MSKERAASLVDAGVFLQLAGDLQGARDLFKRAMSLDPQNMKARNLFVSAGGVIPLPTPPTPELAPTLVRGLAPVPAPAAVVDPLNVRVARPILPHQPLPVSAPVRARATLSAPNPQPDPSSLQTLPVASSFLGLKPDAPTASAPASEGATTLVPMFREPTVVPPDLVARPRHTDVEEHLLEADQLLRRGTYDQALECVMRVLRVDAENLAAHEKAYEILRASGNLSTALDQLVNVMRLLMKRGDVDRASACLQTLRRERPERPDLAGFLALLGDPGETLVLSDEHFKPVRDGARTLVLPTNRPSKKP